MYQDKCDTSKYFFRNWDGWLLLKNDLIICFFSIRDYPKFEAIVATALTCSNSASILLAKSNTRLKAPTLIIIWLLHGAHNKCQIHNLIKLLVWHNRKKYCECYAKSHVDTCYERHFKSQYKVFPWVRVGLCKHNPCRIWINRDHNSSRY